MRIITDYGTNENQNPSVAITMGNRVVNDENGKPITLYAVIVRGTEGTMEWISDFDIGNGDIALGFDKAASRVMRHFAQYVKNNPPLDGRGGFITAALHIVEQLRDQTKFFKGH